MTVLKPKIGADEHETVPRALVVTNLERAATITSTGSSNTAVPTSSAIFRGGNQRSHWPHHPPPIGY